MTDAATIWAAGAAAASAIATALAAYATWRAPGAAAELAERLRRDAENANENRRMKMTVFATLMQERSAIYGEQAVRMLNVIDVVFNDCREVREAWAELFLAFSIPEMVNGPGLNERIRILLAAMARNLGLGDQFGTADLSRVYIPNAVVQSRQIQDLERQATLARLQGAAPQANTTATGLGSMFPPPPIR